MFGLPPANPQDQPHPSCRSQMGNVDSMPTPLDLLYKSPTENNDATDGELHSTTTTPLNYMRRSTPTSHQQHVHTLQPTHEVLPKLSEDFDGSRSSTLDDLRYSASIEDFSVPEKRRPSLENEQVGDAASESTAEPLHYAFQPDNLRNAPSATASARSSGNFDDLDLSVMSLNQGSSLDPTAKKFTEPVSYQQPRQGENPHLEFLQSGRELVPPQDPRLRQHLQSLQQQQQSSLHQQQPQQAQQLSQQQQYAPLPRTNGAYRPGNTSGYSIGEQRELLGLPVPPAISFPPAQPASAPHYASPQQGFAPGVPPLQGSRRSTPNSTPTHATYATAQQMPLPIVPGASAGGRYPAPQPAYGSYEARGGPPMDDFSGDLSGMAARAMSSNDPFGDVEGLASGRMPLPYAAHAPAQLRSPTHLQQQQMQQPGYATSPRYNAGPHGGAPMGAPYGQPPAPYQQSGYQQPGYQAGYQNMGAPAGMGMGQELIYVVQFKRGTRSFTLSSRVNFAVNERDFVVVEADRGEDIGIVIEIISMHAFLERRMNMPRPAPQQGAEPQDDQNVCCILRLATLHERQQLPDKFHTEKDIVQSCNELAMYGFGLPIVVFEAELQFDRRKLTIYYDCNVRIDFRDFVRQLYSTYKARIWMKKVSPHVQPDVQPFAAMALATGVQFSQSAGMGMGMGGPGGY